MGTFLVTSDVFANHLTPPGHPERASRARVMQAVARKRADLGVPVLAARPATREELLRVHAPAYLDRIAAASGRAVALDVDTYTSSRTPEVAALAAGAAIVAVDAVLGSAMGEAGSGAVALVRPPGHHAEANRTMGFCIYNNVAVAAAHALARGLARVAIVDYDVHHGNGTQWTFYRDPRVLFASVHQFPFYPGTGAAGEAGVGAGEGFTVNVPMQANATDGDYRVVFDRLLLPVLHAFSPQLLLVSAGFDAHMNDPLANMRLSVRGFRDLAARLCAAASSARCPLVFVTEGGYHLKVLEACLDGVIDVLTGTQSHAADEALPPPVRGGSDEAEPLTADDLPLLEYGSGAATHRGRAAVELVRAVQKRYWSGL